MAHGFVLLEKSDTKRFYQLPHKCISFPAIENITDHFNEFPFSLREGITFDDDFSNGIDKVCISDAHTHIERLVFPAFYTKDKDERNLVFVSDRISGQMTFSIYGGDISTIRDDLVYLRQIMMLNRR
jgi:hypothetical protein